MATTYYSYDIKYGGTTIWNDTTQPLQSIGIQYGGITRDTMVSATTKTLPTANKLMTSDLIIGDKTLPTNGKYMSGDISITTTQQSTSYTWLKYNAIGTTVRYDSTSSGTLYLGMVGRSSYSVTIYDGTPYIKSDGTWGGSYGSGEVTSSSCIGKNFYVSSTKYFHCNSVHTEWVTAEGWSFQIYVMDGINHTVASRTDYTKGDTLYGEVRSSNASAYPTNGAQGGYWYVKVERWEKFNSQIYYYSYTSATYTSAGTTFYSMSGTPVVRALWRNATGYRVESNGTLTLTGGYSQDYPWGGSSAGNKSVASSGQYCSGLVQAYTAPSSGLSFIFYGNGSNINLKWSYNNDYAKYQVGSDSGSVLKYQVASSYKKGSTNYGYVYNTSASAYPNNGRHTDGYWYIKA